MVTVGVAAWIARLAFPALLIVGWMRGELGPKAALVFVILGLAAWFGLPRLLPNGENYVTSALALLDVVLVLAVFKGDVRLT